MIIARGHGRGDMGAPGGTLVVCHSESGPLRGTAWQGISLRSSTAIAAVADMASWLRPPWQGVAPSLCHVKDWKVERCSIHRRRGRLPSAQ